mgnify:CR=1
VFSLRDLNFSPKHLPFCKRSDGSEAFLQFFNGNGKVVQIEGGGCAAHEDLELNRIDCSPYGVSEKVSLIGGSGAVDI